MVENIRQIDITELRKRVPMNELRRQREKFQSLPLVPMLLDAIPTYVSVLNQHRQIIFANKILRTNLGLGETPEALGGVRTGEVFGCVNAMEAEGGCGCHERCRSCGAFQAIVKAQLEGIQGVAECNIAIHHRGRDLQLLVWATPFEVEGERFILFAADDIGDRMRRRALERIFLHDILNSLGGLHGFSQLLKEKCATTQEAGDIIETICQVSENLIHEIENHKQLLAAENNELTVQVCGLSSLGFMKEVLQRFRAHQVSQDRKLVIDPASQDLEFMSDPILLGRVLGNLVKNALESSDPGDTVTIGCRETDDGQVEFWVHNSASIAPEIQDNIFKRSVTTKGRGRGLGTYSVRLLTERYLNGQASFTSTPDEGTTFRIRLPKELPYGESCHEPQAV